MPLGFLKSHTCISSPAETEILEDIENAVETMHHSRWSRARRVRVKITVTKI
jgi:hypothetical protein